MVSAVCVSSIARAQLLTALHWDRVRANSCLIAVPNTITTHLHDRILREDDRLHAPFLLLGDSLTYGWRTTGVAAWGKVLRPAGFANLGVGDDRVENLLWRITIGRELERCHPEAVCIEIGINNLARNTPGEITAGIQHLVDVLRSLFPKARIIVFALLPTGRRADSRQRKQQLAVNAALVRLRDSHVVRFGEELLTPEGILPTAVSMDGIHLTAAGYELWAPVLLQSVCAPAWSPSRSPALWQEVREASPDAAGVGGPIPALTTINSIATLGT